MATHRETDGYWWKRGTLVYTLRHHRHALTIITERADPSLITQLGRCHHAS